ncbi:MAG: C4-dicarboxylate TRAP transporter substrate-binding protein [Fusobacteriaceae bacterium]|nr:C4-dicarboxylate TRAP transporter substrate-binding protein [Fusobacteriaceae bacterium]
MKKLIVLLMSIIMTFLFLAHGANKVVSIQIGYENNPGEPFDQACREWKRLIEEKSNGTMKVELFPSSQLGSKNDLIDQMIAGDSVITLADGAFYADRGVADMGITFGPYFFETWDEAWKLVKSDWWKSQSDLLEQKGLKIVAANWIYGDRHTLSRKPIRTVADFNGQKIRVPNNLIQVKGLEIMGATPTPMPLGEAYTALQQGTIDGLENPLPVLYNGKFHEVAKYLTLDAHVKNFTTLICGTIFFNTLTQEQQKVLFETGEEAGIFNNKLQENLTKEMLDKFKAEGVEIIEVDIAKFKEKAKGFYELPEFTSKWSKGLVEATDKAKK